MVAEPRFSDASSAFDALGKVHERRADNACGDDRCCHRRCWIEEAHVTELTGLRREGPGGDQLKLPSRRGQ